MSAGVQASNRAEGWGRGGITGAGQDRGQCTGYGQTHPPAGPRLRPAAQKGSPAASQAPGRLAIREFPSVPLPQAAQWGGGVGPPADCGARLAASRGSARWRRRLTPCGSRNRPQRRGRRPGAAPERGRVEQAGEWRDGDCVRHCPGPCCSPICPPLRGSPLGADSDRFGPSFGAAPDIEHWPTEGWIRMGALISSRPGPARSAGRPRPHHAYPLAATGASVRLSQRAGRGAERRRAAAPNGSPAERPRWNREGSFVESETVSRARGECNVIASSGRVRYYLALGTG